MPLPMPMPAPATQPAGPGAAGGRDALLRGHALPAGGAADAPGHHTQVQAAVCRSDRRPIDSLPFRVQLRPASANEGDDRVSPDPHPAHRGDVLGRSRGAPLQSSHARQQSAPPSLEPVATALAFLR
ncbi:hypothetical protein R5R35_006975 [Gryllus longicercus]|uniref:Uncharacterized protein n=1 Tax=Gryllus longicercus TaxID=2509291 RepID=A0AAN9VP21_9ORTH